MIVDPEELEYLKQHPEALADMPEAGRREMEIILGLAPRPKGWVRKMVELCGPLPVPVEQVEREDEAKHPQKTP